MNGKPRTEALALRILRVYSVPLFIALAPLTQPCRCVAAGAAVPWGYSFAPMPEGLSNLVAVSSGTYVNLGLRSDGTVVLWGYNYFDPVSPTNVPAGLTNVVQIVVGYAHQLARRSDGTVVAWGAGPPNGTNIFDYGQSAVPASMTNATAIATGNDFSMALRPNGTVAVWGAITNLPAHWTNIVAIAAGTIHALGLKANGTVLAYQENIYSSVVTNVPANLSNVVAIAGGGTFSLALRTDGTVTAWGFGDYGQTVVPPGLSNVVGIACGEYHALAIRSDHTVVAWGAGVPGSNAWPHFAQSAVPACLSNVTAVSAGYFNSLALNNGSPAFITPPAGQTNFTGVTIGFNPVAVGLEPLGYQWQHNGTNIAGATALSLSLTNVQLTDAGSYRLIASNPYGTAVSPEAWLALSNAAPLITKQPASQSVLITSNVLLSINFTGSVPITCQWRRNDSDVPGAAGSALLLTNVHLSDGGDFTAVLANSFGAVTSAVATVSVTPSIVIGWGYGGYGQTNHPPGLTNVIAVAGGTLHSVALQENGVVVAWGGWGSGQTNVPPGLTNVVAIAAGGDFCVALRDDGRVTAWGDNAFGQTNVPASLTNAVAIGAGDLHALAVKSDGTLSGWGRFRVFDRTINVPFWIPAGLSNMIAVATGNEQALALRANGTVAAWGYNFTPGLTNPPASLTNAVAIACGYTHCLALRSDRTVVAWGNNTYGQTSVPAGLSNVVAIAAGNYHCLALKRDGTVVAWGAGTNATGSNFPLAGQARVPAGLENVVAIAGGEHHTLAVRDLRPQSLVPVRSGWSNSVFNVFVPTRPGRIYLLESKDSLSDTNWRPLRLTAGTGTLTPLTDNAATNSQRFYRARSW